MIFAIETICLCLLFWLICFLGTGSDEKNLKSFRSYPKELRDLLLEDPKFKDKIKVSNPIVTFISNTVMFLVILFLLGIAIRTDSYLYNFIALLIMGQTLNLFDLLIIDLSWYRNVKRTKFKEYPNKSLYMSPKEHVLSSVKALFMFTIVATIDGAFLILF